jgi:CheY-like chemotaxis protein
VLIVEDDPFQRIAIAAELEAAGCSVLDAFSADEAIAILESNREIVVLITDVHMAGDLDGLALARVVRESWPDVAVLVTSGLVAVQESELPAGAVFLPKPVLPERLVQQVHAAVR